MHPVGVHRIPVKQENIKGKNDMVVLGKSCVLCMRNISFCSSFIVILDFVYCILILNLRPSVDFFVYEQHVVKFKRTTWLVFG